MKKRIVTGVHNIKKRSENVYFLEEAKSIIKDLEDTLAKTQGYGLTANQIGILKRVSIIRMDKCNLNLINPIILERIDKIRYTKEGCLSIPGLRIDTTRYKQIKIETEGKQYILYGLEAIVCQHEVDHMNGMTFIDRKWKKQH